MTPYDRNDADYQKVDDKLCYVYVFLFISIFTLAVGSCTKSLQSSEYHRFLQHA